MSDYLTEVLNKLILVIPAFILGLIIGGRKNDE